mmetsp:Transcript_17061/g.53543  ORF Transcript_17061/g.53543 Transcript_17061/m.53543 type:complete len:296 (+) Transcript_17061:171-1058(+)
METASWSSGLKGWPTASSFSTPSPFQTPIILSKSFANRSATACWASPSIFRFCLARSNSSAIGNSSLISGTAAWPRAAASSCRVRVRKFSTSSLRRSWAILLPSAWTLSSSISSRSLAQASSAASESSSSTSSLGSSAASSVASSLAFSFLSLPPPKSLQTWRDLLGVGVRRAARKAPAQTAAGRTWSHEAAAMLDEGLALRPPAEATNCPSMAAPWSCRARAPGLPAIAPRKVVESIIIAATAQKASSKPDATRRRKEQNAPRVLRNSMTLHSAHEPRCGYAQQTPSEPRAKMA